MSLFWSMAAMLGQLRRRRAYAPTSNTASQDNHEKINSWVSFIFPLHDEYGAPLGGPSGRRSSAKNAAIFSRFDMVPRPLARAQAMGSRTCADVILLCLKEATYSFTIARALRRKAQVICTRSKENVRVFRYFITPTWAQKAKLTVNFLAFPPLKFRETLQTGSKCFTLVGAHYSGKSIRPVFSQREKTSICKNRKTCLCLKFVSRRMRCAVKILEYFTEGNSKLWQIKP